MLALRTLAVLTLAAIPGFVPTSAQAQAQNTTATIFPDLRSVVLRESEMTGFSADAARTAAQDRPDGSVTFDAVYVRPAGASGIGPSEVRLAAARTSSGKASAQALSSTKDALLGAGWTLRAVPLLGDEAVGFEAAGTPAGGASNAGYGYVFRFGRHLIGAVLSGPASSTTFDHALGYAVQMSARLDAMLALAPVPDPDPSPYGGTVAMAQPAVSASAASSTAGASTTGTTANASAAPATSAGTGTTVNAAATTPASTGTTAAAIPSSTRAAVSVATVMADVRLSDAPELANGFKLGGFSGLVAPDSSGSTFITVTDRGPNGEIKIGKEKGMVFPIKNYSPRVVKMRLDGERLRVTEMIPLRLPEGFTDPVTGTREISGLPNFDNGGENAYSPDGKTAYGTDPNGVDTEGIAFDSRDGSFWLADEYGPSILHAAADGTLLMRITPKGLGLSMNGVAVRELLPSAYKMRKPNRGFEGIAISPDGARLFVMLQSPLLNPDKKTGEESRNVRIAVFDTTDGDNPKLAGIYLYQMERASDVGAPTQDDLKIGDMSGISRTTVLVAERDSVEGGKHKKAYIVDISGATDVSSKEEISGRTIEQASETDLKKANIAYVKKTMAVDLAKLGFSPDKFEGLAVIDSTTIAVVNDNDFGVSAIDSRGNVVKGGAMPRLVVIRVPQPIQ
jgi:hypothetical protein